MKDFLAKLRGFSTSAKLFLFTSFFFGLSGGIRKVARNLYFLSLGFDASFVGFVVGVGTFTGLLVALPSGHLGDRFGPKKALVATTILGSIGIFLQGTDSRIPILIGAGLYRVSMSMFFIAGPALMAAASEKKERTHLFSIFSSVRRLSIIPGALLGGYMPGIVAQILGLEVEAPMSYRLTIFLQAILLGLALVPLLLISCDSKQSGKEPDAPGSGSYDWSFLSQPVSKKILVPSLLIGLGAGMIFPFLNVIFKHYGASTRAIGWIFTIQSLFTGSAVLLAPRISERWDKTTGLAIVRILSIPFLLVVGYAGYVPVMAGALMFRSSFMRMASPLRNNLLMNIARPGERSKLNGVRQVASRLGRTAAGPIAGWIIASISYSLPFLITSILYLLGTSLFYINFHPLEETEG